MNTTYTLDKSCTSKLYVERVAHNGILILTDNETGISMRYMGYGIQQAKRLFKEHLKELTTWKQN